MGWVYRQDELKHGHDCLPPGSATVRDLWRCDHCDQLWVYRYGLVDDTYPGWYKAGPISGLRAIYHGEPTHSSYPR